MANSLPYVYADDGDDGDGDGDGREEAEGEGRSSMGLSKGARRVVALRFESDLVAREYTKGVCGWTSPNTSSSKSLLEFGEAVSPGRDTQPHNCFS
jgi:hypothetical protein